MRGWFLLFIYIFINYFIVADWLESPEFTGYDFQWFIQLFIQHFVIGHCRKNYFAVRLRKNRILNEPMTFEEI